MSGQEGIPIPLVSEAQDVQYNPLANQFYPTSIEELEEDNTILRKLLWINHGCDRSALYGDDGEMQCNKCMIDFKRMSAKEIQTIWRSRWHKYVKEHPEEVKKILDKYGITSDDSEQ